MLDEQHRFITDASHELKTPLTALRSEIEVYLMGKKRTLKEAEIILASNLEEVIRLQNLSQSLVRLAKHRETNGEGIHATNLSLLAIVESALKKVVPLARKKQITINNDIIDVQILGEKQSLIEVFVVLLDNAIKYSPEQTTVTISSRKTDHSVRIRIMDQGLGIDPTDIPHIFERFYRADKSRTKSETTGYGLGLAIVKQIIEDHKGTVSVTSNTGKGTTFTLRLNIQK